MTDLEKLLSDPEYADLLTMSPEDKKLHDSLFNSPRAKARSKQTLGQSMAILTSGGRRNK